MTLEWMMQPTAFAGDGSAYKCCVDLFRVIPDGEVTLPEKSTYLFRYYISRTGSGADRRQHNWSSWANVDNKKAHEGHFVWPNVTSGVLYMTPDTWHAVYEFTVELPNDGLQHSAEVKAGCDATIPKDCKVVFGFYTAKYVNPTPGTPTLSSDFNTIAMNSVLLNWTAADNAERYNLEQTVTDLSGQSYTDVIDVNGTQHTLPVELGYNYVVRIRGVSGDGTAGAWSNTITVNNCGTVKVKQGGGFKNATPYVKTDQGWKKAAAYIKNGAGVWVPAKTR